MLHFRVICPIGGGVALSALLLDQAAVHNLVLWAGVARRPDGDLIQFDVAREAGNDIVTLLRSQSLDHRGSIAIERIDTAISDAAAHAELQAPGDPSEAVIWEEVESRLRDDSSLSVSHVIMLTIAVAIAAIGILTDSAVLIVGAMVIGPEYGPLASIALGLHQRRRHRVARGLRTIAVAFPIAIAITYLLSMIIDAAGQTPAAYSSGQRPLTQFISQPDIFSIVVAILAGIAGTIALTEAKAGSLVGVLVSVTTVPAAANIAVALAHQRGSEAIGATIQLFLNLAAITITGAITLRGHWTLTHKKTQRSCSDEHSEF